MKRVEGKVAVITGGNSGIGKGIAKKFAEEGAKVAIFGRSLETLEKTKQELPGEILAVRGDVTNAEDLKKLFSEVEKHYGKTDILVANAGVGKKVHVEKATEEDFDYVVDINYKGVFFTVKYSIPHLNAKASILLIASTAAYEIAKGRSIYSSTKAAVSKLAQGFANDLADRTIRVNAISPGYIETPIFDQYLKKEPDFLEKRKEEIPLKRIGTPEDIGNAALFLSSDEASYITGADLIVDGGLLIS